MGRHSPLPLEVRNANTWGGQIVLEGRSTPGPIVSVVQINVPPEYERDWTIHFGGLIDDRTGAPFAADTPRALLATVQYGSRLGSVQEFRAHVPARGATWSVRGSSVAVLAQYTRSLTDPSDLRVRVSAEILDATPPDRSHPWEPPRLVGDATQLPAQATGAALVASVPARAVAFRIVPIQTAVAGSVVGPAAFDGWVIGQYQDTTNWVFLVRVARLTTSNLGLDAWTAIPGPVRQLWAVMTTATNPIPVRVEWLIQP